MRSRFVRNFDPGLKRFKHRVFQHWLELACFSAPMISDETPIILPSIFLPRRHERGNVPECSVIGDDFVNSLRLNSYLANFTWKIMETCCTIIADTGSPEEGLTSQNLRNKIKQPCEFACPAEPKSKGLSMRPVSRCWQSCSPTSLRL